MPGESLVKDLAEVFEYWGEEGRLGIPPIAAARYVIQSLEALTDALRALPSPPNAEPPVIDEYMDSMSRVADIRAEFKKGK